MNFSCGKKTVTRRLDFESCGAADETKSSLESGSEEHDRKNEELKFNAGEVRENMILMTESNSPILFWKCSSMKKTTKASSAGILTTKRSTMKSPVFRIRKKKKRKKEEKADASASVGTASGIATPSSPIFTCKSVHKKKKIKTAQTANDKPEKNKVRAETSSSDSAANKGTKSLVFGSNSTFENLNEKQTKMKYPEIPLIRGCCRNITDFKESKNYVELEDTVESYEIEDFSQELPEERFDSATQTTKISNFSSDGKIYEDTYSLQGQSREISLSVVSGLEICKSSSRNESETENTLEFLDSGRKRKRFKKGSLVERLDILRKRLASERRIREHKKKVMKARQNWKKTLFVLDLWKDVTRLMLKCQEVEVGEGSRKDVALGENFYIILDKENGIDFKNIKEGSVLRIAPPWQEMQLQKFGASILLSLSSLELIDKLHGIKPKIGLREASITKYRENEESLFDVLLNSEADSFFVNE